jgi:putative oxidoreductase
MDLALLLVRLLGLGLAAHGTQKLFGWFGGYGLAGTGGFFESLGFRPGKLFAAAAGLSETVGGILIFLGLLGPVGPMLIIATMLVATFTVHLEKGFFGQNGGYELPFAYIGISLALAFVGFGAYSLDNVAGIGALWTPAIAWIAIALAVIGALANLAVRRKPAAVPSSSA